LKLRIIIRDGMCVQISMTLGEQSPIYMCAWHDRVVLVYSNIAGHVMRPMTILSVGWRKLKRKKAVLIAQLALFLPSC
jgi:hypothetical protein